MHKGYWHWANNWCSTGKQSRWPDPWNLRIMKTIFSLTFLLAFCYPNNVFYIVITMSPNSNKIITREILDDLCVIGHKRYMYCVSNKAIPSWEIHKTISLFMELHSLSIYFCLYVKRLIAHQLFYLYLQKEDQTFINVVCDRQDYKINTLIYRNETLYLE